MCQTGVSIEEFILGKHGRIRGVLKAELGLVVLNAMKGTESFSDLPKEHVLKYEKQRIKGLRKNSSASILN